MTLSKQLYIIISFIFFMIFAGNFIISVNNFKDYLEVESTTSSAKTATTLKVKLEPILSQNIYDPEIKLILRATGNSSSFKDIRLENIAPSFTKEMLFEAHSMLDETYQIKDIYINENDGDIINSNTDDELSNELAQLEDTQLDSEDDTAEATIYSFIPSESFPCNGQLTVHFTAYNDTNTIPKSSKISINNILAQASQEEKFDSVPQWFIDMIPMKMTEVQRTISDGWKNIATLYITANAGDAYLKLYEQAKGAVYYAMISFTIAFAILIVFLRFILKPLKDIETLAKNISQGKFETIAKLPWTLELKNVSISMNDMSNKIKNMIGKLNGNLEKMTNQLSKDDLTGLEQEQTFNTDVKMMFIKKKDGYIFSIKMNNFTQFAKNNTNKVIDSYVKDFAGILRDCDKDIRAYRFYGSVFALISYKIEHTQIEEISKKLKVGFDELSLKYGISNIANIGATPFNPISTTEDILGFANNAYEEAKNIGENEFYIRGKEDLAADMLVWKELVCGIIDNSTFNVAYINQTISMDGKNTTLQEETFTSSLDNNGKTIQIGTFISVAEMYNKIIDFDKAVINQVIKHIKTEEIKHEILINLAFDSLANDDFKIWLEQLLIQNKELAHQLVFSVTAYGCVKDIESFKIFVSLLHKNGAKIILKRFETKFIPLDNLKEFNLDYIKLAKDYTKDITTDSSKQSFVESICELSKLLNIKVFAEMVNDESDFNKLQELGMYGASIKNILRYEGRLTQGIVSHCMDELEDNIVNIGIMGKVATASVELLQNMMNYSKTSHLGSNDIKSAGFIEVTKDKNYVYYILTKNIVSLEDKEKIEPKLIEIQGLDSESLRKRYRELRRSGENTHEKGGGIGFYEIAKLTSSLEYEFISINEEKYNFIFKISIESKKKKEI